MIDTEKFDNELLNEIKGSIRAIRLENCLDPFIEYQEGRMSKGKLLEIISPYIAKLILDT